MCNHICLPILVDRELFCVRDNYEVTFFPNFYLLGHIISICVVS